MKKRMLMKDLLRKDCIRIKKETSHNESSY